jgi:hypothetical protein
MRKLMALVLVCALTTTQSLKAQYYYYNDKYYDNAVVLELGGSFGIMNALTDLGGKKGIGKGFIKDLNMQNTKPCFGIYALAMYKNAIGVRLQATFGHVQSYDSILKDVKTTTYGRYERNLSFKSKITDFQLGIEVHPLFFKEYDDDEDPPKISPYLVAGVGYYSFDPKAYLNGEWYSLQPLHLEGQGFKEYPNVKSYKLSQVNFSAGLGVKYEINSMFNARFEINHRFLTTDYLDDVSGTYIDPSLFYNYLPVNLAAKAQQLYNRKGELNPTDATSVGDQRGDPGDNDSFFTVELKLGFTIGRQHR